MLQFDFEAFRAKRCELVSVSKELASSNRTMYLSLPKSQSKLNGLLQHRLLLEKFNCKKAAVRKVRCCWARSRSGAFSLVKFPSQYWKLFFKFESLS